MADSGDGSYTLSWECKPLGFSIVMDTTGKNAYVSSIQKVENCEKGLRLAAQIIAVNGTNVIDKPHGDILKLIKEHPSNQTIKLTFQPRSFANQKKDEQSNKKYPQFLAFKGATRSQNRVNGRFELCTQEMMPEDIKLEDGKYNNRPVWRRHSDEDIGDDQIYCWFWPKEDKANQKAAKGRDLWMISRGSGMGTDGAYACVEVKKLKVHENTQLEAFVCPIDIKDKWQIFNSDKQKFEDDLLVINSADM